MSRSSRSWESSFLTGLLVLWAACSLARGQIAPISGVDEDIPQVFEEPEVPDEVRLQREKVAELEKHVAYSRERLRRELTGVREAPRKAVDTARRELQEAQDRLAEAKAEGRRYLEGVYPEQVASLESSVKNFEEELRFAEEALGMADKQLAENTITPGEHKSFQLAKQLAYFTLKEAETKLLVLREYHKGKELKKREADVRRAQADVEEMQTELDAAIAYSERVETLASDLDLLNPDDHAVALLQQAFSKEAEAMRLMAGVAGLDKGVDRTDPQALEKIVERIEVAMDQLTKLKEEKKSILKQYDTLSSYLFESRAQLAIDESKLSFERRVLSRLEQAHGIPTAEPSEGSSKRADAGTPAEEDREPGP